VAVVLAHEDVKEDIEQPLDIRAPGSDLANFPNSAFTLPRGGFYLESTPVAYAASSSTLSAQYNWEYLVRYGLVDWLELRLYSQGFSVQGSPNSAVGFSPLTFDTKIHFWDEWEEYHLPAAGLEAMVQTQLLGSSAFNAGTEPSFSLKFDQELPRWNTIWARHASRIQSIFHGRSGTLPLLGRSRRKSSRMWRYS
jgi:hypothetical protein